MNGYFSLTYQYQHTNALPFTISAADLQKALRASFTLVGNPLNITATGADGDFTITFDASLGDVALISAQVVPLAIVGNAGTDRLSIQSTYEETSFVGGDNSDSATLNVDAASLAPFTPGDVVGH